jgi:hypothetical protein
MLYYRVVNLLQEIVLGKCTFFNDSFHAPVKQPAIFLDLAATRASTLACTSIVNVESMPISLRAVFFSDRHLAEALIDRQTRACAAIIARCRIVRLGKLLEDTADLIWGCLCRHFLHKPSRLRGVSLF